ncbi:bifunctional diguanylate cyclase/phosphodiesterase [Vibrio sp. A14(2019)]|uniref:putative bifunctional diguanylate cyclase/phosphodiesterase n=1 Tax=Vibrio sp. A14(2019) TaxID=2591428 RepID=UPI0027BE53DD|nr:EAL domain-containing protein [Vibrio sp. A14(2019)]MDQ2192494.1 EAL domain-containing protein [Vibrio sp. A14(2019)]
MTMSFPQEEYSISDLDSAVAKQRLVHILDFFSQGLFYMSSDGHMVLYNPTFYVQFGVNSETISYADWLSLVHPMDRALLNSRVDEHISTTESRETIQYRVKKANGQYIWLEGNAVTKSVNGEHFMVGSHKDISDQKLMEDYIHQAAFFDSSSGLYNRSKLLLDIDEKALKIGEPYSLIYIQLEDIKSYLNQYGSDIVKDLLNHVVSALRELPDEFADFYRIRSDDFAILLRGERSYDELKHICSQIMKHYSKSATEHGHLYGNDISIGVYPEINRTISADELLNIASRTCQFASAKNHSRIEIYSGRIQKNVDRYFFIERGLKEALDQRSLSVKFQPIIHAQSGQISSFEALVRWRSKEFGEIFPDEFIPVAEKKGLIVDLGYFVFKKACEFIGRYNKQNGVNIRVNINVSVLQLLKSDFPQQILTMANASGVLPSSIVLELTETVILDGDKNAINQLHSLNEMGFQLSLDDFGAGFSSLNSFFDLPLNQIKIDKSIVWKTLTNPASEQYLAFLIQFCHTNGVDIVIEGVENGDMYQKFKEMGATYLQGYWFSKPLSLASASRYTLNAVNE